MKNRTDNLNTWHADQLLNGKLTYFGDQEKPVSSTFFASASLTGPSAYAVFVPHQTPGYYANDLVGNACSFTLSPPEQAALLTNLAAVDPGQPGPSTVWALVMVQAGPAGTRSVEWFLDRARARVVVSAIASALSSANVVGREILARIPLN